MLVFPQLSTGTAALYPVTSRVRTRSVVSELGDGRTLVFRDADGVEREWELGLAGMTAAESGAVENLFAASAGRLRRFTLLDPTGNLLARSSEFGDAVWVKGPQIQLTFGLPDPLGGTGATRVVNSGAGDQTVVQTIGAPGNFVYVFSIWARSASNSSVVLSATAPGGSANHGVGLDSTWRRVHLPVELQVNTDTVTFGVQMSPGASVDLFGAQVEAQPGVSDYKRTGATGGVIAGARFASDELRMRAVGTDVFEAEIRIVSPGA